MSRVAARTRMSRVTQFKASDLSGLQAWYKAEGLGLADGVAVASWADESVNGRTLTQATGSKQPTWKYGIQGGRPVVRFAEASAQVVASATFGPLAQPTTIVVVGVRSGGTDDVFIDGLGVNRNIVLKAGNGNWRVWGGSSFQGATVADTSWHVLSATFNGASTAYRKDGSAITAGSAGTAAFGGVTLGAWGDGAANGWLQGDIAEVCVYNPSLSAGDLTTLERALGAKYGIVVA